TAFSFRAVSGDVEPTALRWTMPQRLLPRLQPNSGLPEFGRFIDWPKSETSEFGWRDREGARNMIEMIEPFPPPPPSPASGGGSRPNSLLALILLHDVSPRPLRSCGALADRRLVRHQPWRQDRSRGRGRGTLRRQSSRPRRMRPLRALRRDGRRRGGGDRGDGRGHRPRA